MKKISAVYKVTNTITGDFYIGSSKDAKRRWITHKAPSVWARHPNLRMYQDMAQYGLNNFTFEIIEETSDLKEREQYFIDLLRPSYNSNRANGWDFERYKEYYNTNKDKMVAQPKEYWERNKEKYRVYSKEHMRKYRQSEKGKENNRKSARKSMKRYNNQLCLYNGETVKLNALAQRFQKQGMPHPVLEAKKYLLNSN